MSAISFNSLAIQYDREMGENGNYNHQNTIDPALFKAAGTIKGKKVYDIGCGNGYIARRLVKLGAKKVLASDISETLIKIAQAKYNNRGVEYQIQDGANFSNLPEKYFDLVILNMVIHYIKEVDAFFKGVNSILKNNGRIAFTTEHPLGEVARADMKRSKSLKVVVEKTKS